MKWTKIAAAGLGLVLLALVLVAIFGIPAGALIESFARDATAKSGLQLTIAGPARLTLWPQLGVAAEKVELRDETSGDLLFTVERADVGVSLGDLFARRVRLTEIALTRPVVRFDAMADRAARRGKAAPAEPAPAWDGRFAVDTITAEDATFVVRDRRRTVEIQVESLRVAAAQLPNERVNVKLEASLNGRNLRVVADADPPARLSEGKPVAVEAQIEGIFKKPATLTASLQTTGPVLKINELKGTSDQGRIGGAVTISFAGAKPFIDADLDADRLDLSELIDAPAAAPGAPRPWSDQPVDLIALRMVDANVKLAARDVRLRKVRIAPVALEASLIDEALAVKLSRAAMYGGEAEGELSLDASREIPNLALRVNFSQIGALPFLSDTIDFQHVEGQARGRIDLKAAGASELRVMKSLQGSAELAFEDGAVRGIDVVKMVRSLVNTILSGWQPNGSDQTRFSMLSASFRVENGLARTDDLRFVGPFVGMSGTGVVDLPNKSLNFRTDPKVVLSAEGQGRQSEPWGIGVPVLIQGPWSAPRIYADLPGILSNPEGALQALRNALGGAGGQGGQPGAPIGQFMEGLTEGMEPAQREQLRGGAAIVDEFLRALSGEGKSGAPAPRQPERPGAGGR
jgi:AsmA protein